MPYPHKSLWRYMHQKPSYEFNPIQSQFFPFAVSFIIFNLDSYGIFIHSEDTAVADCQSMCVAPKIMHDCFCSCKRFPDIRNPLFFIAVIQKFLIFILVTVFFCISFVTEFTGIVQGFKSSQKFPFEQFCHRFSREEESVLFLMPAAISI